MGWLSHLSVRIPAIPDEDWPLWLPPSPARWQRMLTSAESERALRRKRFAGGSLGKGGIAVSPGDRWYILGDSGTGKTTFTGHLVRHLRHLFSPIKLYVHDAKGDDFFESWPGLIVSERPPSPLASPNGVQVWRPSTIGTSAITATERWLERILTEREPAIVWFNEIKLLSKGRAQDYPPQIGQLYTTGRSLGMQPVTESQEAAYMPRQVGGQASHFVSFGLRNDPHGARIAARMLGHFDERGYPLPKLPAADFGFFYRHLGRHTARTWEYPSYRDFF